MISGKCWPNGPIHVDLRRHLASQIDQNWMEEHKGDFGLNGREKGRFRPYLGERQRDFYFISLVIFSFVISLKPHHFLSKLWPSSLQFLDFSSIFLHQITPKIKYINIIGHYHPCKGDFLDVSKVRFLNFWSSCF